MDYEKILIAIHWWCVERSELDERQNDLVSLLPMVFRTLDSLFYISRNKRTPWSNVKAWQKVVHAGTNGLSFDIRLDAEQYTLFRAMISLVGDIYHLLEPLQKYDLLELTDPVRRLYSQADVNRDARNFFTHLDERLTCYDAGGIRKHGVSGPGKSRFGVTHTSTAKGYVYALLIGDEFHFTTDGKIYTADFGDKTIEPLFESGRSIYAQIISHRLHAQEYVPPNELFKRY